MVTYWSKKKKMLVILDAFESHKHKDMNEMLKQVGPLAQHVIRLIEDGE